MQRHILTPKKKSARSFIALALAFMLTITWLSDRSFAADTVTNLEFDTTASEILVYAADDAYYLNLYATMSNLSTRVDVTDSATWKSSNTAVAKVTQGAIVGVAKGSAKISATYGGYTKSINVKVEELYDEISIQSGGSAAPDEAAYTLDQSVAFTLNGTKNGTITNITSSASWSSSNTAVASVDKGKLTLNSAGTTTITASYKGKTDSIKITVTSPYQSLVISGSDTIELAVGDAAVSLSAQVQLQGGGTESVTDKAEWTSSAASVATVDKGVIKAVGSGTTTITASYMGVTDTVTVAVRQGAQDLKITPGADLNLQLHDQPVTLTAQALSNNNTVIEVTDTAEWSSSNILVATVSGGVVTPKGLGTTTIKVTYKGASRSIKVTVLPSVSTMTISESDKKVETYTGQTGTLPQVQATSFGGDAISISSLLTWQSSNSSVVSISNGKWKAEAAGTAELSASVNGLKVSVSVTVNEKPLLLTAAVDNLSMIIGKEYSFPTVTVVNENGTEMDVTDKVTWKSSAANLLVQAKGLKGLAAANATLTGTYLNKMVKVNVSIEEEAVKLVVDPKTLTLNPKQSKSLKVTATYKSGKTAVVSTKVNWSISDETVAEFSSKNTIRAVKQGTAVITGTYQDKSVTISLSVVPKLKSLVLSDSKLNLAIGASHTVVLKAFYNDGTMTIQTNAAEWTSSNTKVAEIVDGVIVAKAKGTTSIKAKFGGKTATVRVTVK
ncbi:Ig-like domain-containing protein [Paenibacillus xylaniclasticus]|uniref:Ig-like domain-containing protein n=1 Tax=Paenibacillus xylaniclasticus TaxID=588083 RepID=UPI000FD89B97|nr:MULTISPECIES: Ig-like domain-containing protein [Paenibacillus]GFN32682.1 hypothetical protein PCURB6_29420 [Paenibacillus curdlanolyticus]